MVKGSQLDQEDAIKIIQVEGPRAVQTTVSSFHETLRPYIEVKNPRIVLDMSQVEFMDSSFLGAMVVELKRAIAKQGDIKLCSLQQPVKTLFEMLRLFRIFSIYETKQEAQTSFEKSS